MTHKGDPDFLLALTELRELHLSKGHDYADATDPLRNYVESSRDCGVEPWRGAMLRLSEKYHRLTNLIGKDEAPNFESLEDTLMDMAALSLIVRSLRRRASTPDATGDSSTDGLGQPFTMPGMGGPITVTPRPQDSIYKAQGTNPMGFGPKPWADTF